MPLRWRLSGYALSTSAQSGALNEFGYLPGLERISSVSGGSITAGVLGLSLGALEFNASGVAAESSAGIRRSASRLWLSHGRRVGHPRRDSSSRHDRRSRRESLSQTSLSDRATLQALPDRPRFVINATNVQSGVLCRFSKPYMWDYRVGQIKSPTIELAIAVAASSAFPPVLSPVRLKVDPAIVHARQRNRPPDGTLHKQDDPDRWRCLRQSRT